MGASSPSKGRHDLPGDFLTGDRLASALSASTRRPRYQPGGTDYRGIGDRVRDPGIRRLRIGIPAPAARDRCRDRAASDRGQVPATRDVCPSGIAYWSPSSPSPETPPSDFAAGCPIPFPIRGSRETPTRVVRLAVRRRPWPPGFWRFPGSRGEERPSVPAGGGATRPAAAERSGEGGGFGAPGMR